MIRILLSTRPGEQSWTQADLTRATGICPSTTVEYMLVKLTGVKGKIHNIVFTATRRPDILLADVLTHTVQIPVDEDKYLLYDEEVDANGLTWGELLE